MRRMVLGLVLVASCSKEPPPSAPPPAPPPAGPVKADVISRAQNFSSKDYLVSGYVTILDFYIDGDPTCKALAPKIADLAKRYPMVLLRQVEIANYNSNAAVQARKEFALSSVPFQVVFDGKGASMAKITKGTIEEIEVALKKALGP